jgi:divinyl protochlorophyllide a 8-vinyl-reductase
MTAHAHLQHASPAARIATPGGARIGPNALTRVAEALAERHGAEAVASVYAAAGLTALLREPPTRMVDENAVIALHRAVRARYPRAEAETLFTRAGELTGEYLLTARIPRPFAALLRHLPASFAARLLLAAVSRHAWTFAGSGDFRVLRGRPPSFELADCPLCRDLRTDTPACAYYGATFGVLFRALVHPRSEIEETACRAKGDALCRFTARW